MVLHANKSCVSPETKDNNLSFVSNLSHGVLFPAGSSTGVQLEKADIVCQFELLA